MMMHTFNYSEYEFRETPATQPLPDPKAAEAWIGEAEWNLARLHPIQGALRSLETAVEAAAEEASSAGTDE